MTEFRQPLPGQARPFAAEVLWHDDKAIGKFLKEQLKNFRRMCEPDAAWSSEERREFEKDRNTAEELLHVLFSDRDEFASKRACRKYLTENQLLPLPDAIQQLTSWITDTISKQGREGGITKVEASTSLELRQMLSPYMRHQEGRSSAKRPASFWPLVRCVR